MFENKKLFTVIIFLHSCVLTFNSVTIMHVKKKKKIPFHFNCLGLLFLPFDLFCTPVFLRALGPGTLRQRPTSVEIQFPEA